MMAKKTTKSTEASVLKKRLKQLEKEVATLESDKKKKDRQLWRNIGSGILVGLAAILILFSISALWLQQNIMNTETWVAKSTAVIKDTAVRSAISNAVVENVFQRYDVESYVANNLPEKAQPLAKTITDQLRSFSDKQINNALASEAFIEFWQKANRSAHQGIIASFENANNLSGSEAKSNVIYLDKESVILNLNPVLANITSRLQSRGLNFIPSVGENSKLFITVAEVPNLPKVLSIFNAINAARTWLPIVAFLVGVAAIYLATNRRRALLALGLTTAVLLVLNVQAVYFLQFPFVSQLGSALKSSSTEAGSAIYSIYTEDLVQYSRVAMTLMLLLSFFAFMSGPSKFAVWLRSNVNKLMGGNVDAPALLYLGKNANVIISGLIILSALLMVFLPVGSANIRIAVVIITGLVAFFLLSLSSRTKAR